MFLLELLAGCKKVVTPYAAPGSGSSAGLPHDWGSLPGPATLAHAVALGAGQDADAVLRALVRCGEGASHARLFKWWVDAVCEL